MKKEILFVCVVMASIHVSAQWNGDTLTISKQLEDIVINAQVRQETNNRTELKGDELNKENTGRNLPYLLQTTPSLVATSDDGLGIGYSYFRIRGTDHTRISMAINNVPLNDAESQTVFWVNLTDMAGGTNRIDVRRGVSESVNGNSSFGAGIQLSTLYERNTHRIRGEVCFNGGMYNTFRAMGKLEADIRNWHICGKISKVNSDGYLERAKSDLLSYQIETGWKNKQTSVALLCFGGTEHTYMAWYGADREQINKNRRFNPAGMYLTNMGDTAYYKNQTDNYQQHHLQLHIRHRFNRNWSLTATGHYTHGKGYYEMADYAVCNSNDGLDGILRKGLNNHFYGGIASAKYVSEAMDMQFGTALNHYSGKHIGTWQPEEGKDWENHYLGYGSKLDGNIYAKTIWRIIPEALSVYGDLQYRLIDYRIWGDNDETNAPIDQHVTYHFFNPKTGLTYEHHKHRMYVTFGIANREPARTNFTSANTEEMPLPEHLFDTEAGYSFHSDTQIGNTHIGKREIGINIYWMHYKNQLIPTGRLNDVGAPVTENVPVSYRLGAELTFSVEWTKWLKQNGALTWSRNQWKTINGKWQCISFSPDWIASHDLIFTYSGLEADIQTQVVGKQYLDNTADESATLKAYTVTHLNVSYTLPIKAEKWPVIQLKCQMNNLFDSKYESNGGCSFLTDETGEKHYYIWYYPQAGFNIHAGFRIVFGY